MKQRGMTRGHPDRRGPAATLTMDHPQPGTARRGTTSEAGGMKNKARFQIDEKLRQFSIFRATATFLFSPNQPFSSSAKSAAANQHSASCNASPPPLPSEHPKSPRGTIEVVPREVAEA